MERTRGENPIQCDHASTHAHLNVERYVATENAENLQFWVIHWSTTYCFNCQKLLPVKLLSRWMNRPIVKGKTSCTCIQGRYFSPNADAISHMLKNLSNSENCSLCPLTVHSGQYTSLHNSYCQKGRTFQLTWSKLSILEQIEKLDNQSSKLCALVAYNFLMNEAQSSYEDFVQQREQSLAVGHRFNMYDYQQRRYVECCLWPNLYPTREWCETPLDGINSHLSLKVSFLVKVNSSIADYGLNDELLHFHYNLWIFKTISGPITTGHQRLCSLHIVWK